MFHRYLAWKIPFQLQLAVCHFKHLGILLTKGSHGKESFYKENNIVNKQTEPIAFSKLCKVRKENQ